MINKIGQDINEVYFSYSNLQCNSSSCGQPMSSPPQFNSFKECGIFGYELSAEYLKKMDQKK
jgi:hypothetical protein